MEKVGLFAYGEMGQAALESLIDRFEIIWIVLPPKERQTSAEKSLNYFAKKNKIKVSYETNFKHIKLLIEENLPNIVVVSTFNKVFPNDILSLSKFINVHLGELPKMRGRATVNWAIINNSDKIYISMHEMVFDLDSGNLYSSIPIVIMNEDSVGDVYKKINIEIQLSLADVVVKVLKGFKGNEQIGNPAYYCTRLPNDGLIDFNQNTEDIFNFIRALSKPYPGAFTYYEGKRMIVWDSRIPHQPKKYLGRIIGRVVEIHKDGVEVLTKDSSIIIGNISYKKQEENSSSIIKSVKATLGIDFVSLHERMMTEDES